MIRPNIIEDIQEIVDRTKSILSELEGKKIFLTGGTGFFGKWILEYIKFLNESKRLDIQLIILSRNPDRFKKQNKELANTEGFVFQSGDIRSFKHTHEEVDYIIHAATDASATINKENPELMFESIAEGMNNLLEYAKFCRPKRILMTSSGAVYDPIGPDETFMESNKFNLAATTVYGEGKRKAEQMGFEFCSRAGIDFINARCFAFVGPYMPESSTYAIKNFIDNIKNQEDIIIKGDGTPLRTYMYASDLIVWLFTILIKGRSGESYNVGSDEVISMKDLAHKLSNYSKKSNVVIESIGSVGVAGNRYIPSIEKAKRELGLSVEVSLNDAIEKMLHI
jgi:dTDP-glucose 4,6-dehydratase